MTTSLSPVVKYHGLARRHLMPPVLLMRPLLNGGTLAGLRQARLAPAVLNAYPYAPKSTTRLRIGDFWALPREDGTFACGRVLQVTGDHLMSPTRAFFGGLLDWIGPSPPTTEAIAHAGLLDVGIMHIRAILSTGGEVLGNRPLELDAIEIPTLLSAHGGPGTMVLRGIASVRPATREEWGTLPVLGIWGFNFISLLANKRLKLKPHAG